MHTNGPEHCPCCGRNGDGTGCHRCRPLIVGAQMAMLNSEREYAMLKPISSIEEVEDYARAHYRRLAVAAVAAIIREQKQ